MDDVARARRTSEGAVPVLLEVVWSDPALGGDARVPARVMVAEWLSAGPSILLAFAAAFVFFEAARTHAPGLRVRVQNLAAAIAMVLFALEALIYAAYWTAGTLKPAPLSDLASSATLSLTIPLIVLELAALCVAVVAFYGRAGTDRLAEKAVGFFDCVGRVSEILANVPVWERELSAPYAKLVEASGEEFLGLSPRDGRKAAEAYRMAAVLKRRGAEDGPASSGVGAADMPRLVRLHDEALSDPEFSAWLRSVGDRGQDRRETYSHPGTQSRAAGACEDAPVAHEPLGPLLRLEDERPRAGEPSDEPWEQLARLACAEAGLLPGGARTVSGRVKDAYELADAKLRHGIA